MKSPILLPTRRALLALAGTLVLPAASAQSYPTRPIRIVVIAPAGSVPDIMIRQLSVELALYLPQPLVIDNKPGVGGALAAMEVVRSPADGYTLLFSSDGPLVTNPLAYRNLRYSPTKDLQPVALVGNTGGVIVVPPSLKVRTLPELVQLAQSKPGALNYASGGIGHPSQLAMEIVAKATGMKLTHVPYRGTPQAVQDLIAGGVQILFTGYVEALPYIKSGQLIALASTGPAAKTILPNVASLLEYVPDYNYETWFALLAPTGTADGVVQQLHAAVDKALQSKDLKQKWIELGITAVSGMPATVSSKMQEGARTLEPLIKALGIQLD